ncbi:hypothetical protein BASA81_015307 [Batrachochytrium salamandrivorans]|nr:hypothetical protein BASA81_015307 [Batrachochytrium salamandrivorans]
MYFGYKLTGVIGEGTYGQVFKACKGQELDHEPWIDFGPAIYAVKRQKAQAKDHHHHQNSTAAGDVPETSFSVTLIREIKLLRELHHPNIVQLVDCLLGDDDMTTLVFEYAEFEMMKMIDFYKQNERAIPDYTIKSFMYQSLRGVQYLHENWVVHRDLKPDNILIVGGETSRRGSVVLADLGLARIFRNPTLPLGKVDKVVVTLWYRAPELLLGSLNYTPAIDMWSMGCIFASLLLAKRNKTRALFQGINKDGAQNPFQADQVDRIFRILGPPNPQDWPEVVSMEQYKNLVPKKRQPGVDLRSEFPDISESCYNLLSKLLELNPAKRFSASTALQHPYFTTSPRPGENSLDDPNARGRDALFRQFEQQSTMQGVKPLEFAQNQTQNDQIESRKLALRQERTKRQRV